MEIRTGLQSPRTKGQKTREQILLKAMALFHARGAHQVPLTEISRALDLHQTAIYVHFKNRDDLLAACCEYSVLSSRAEIDAATDPLWPAEKKLQAYVEGQFRFVRDHPERANALLAMYYHGPTSKRLAEIHEWVDRRSIARLHELLTQGQREGAWPGIELDTLAHRMHSQLSGEMIKALNRPRERSFAWRVSSVLAQLAAAPAPAT
jgi:AcrR family transcriptional regulator